MLLELLMIQLDMQQESLSVSPSPIIFLVSVNFSVAPA